MADPADRGAVLVAIAREAIGAHLGFAAERGRAEDWLTRPAATFVTLRSHGALRGCMGTVDAHRPLGEDVSANARSAAFHDPRFAPLAAEEFGGVAIEVSLLSPRLPLGAATEADALQALRPGVDGLYLEYREFRATFLPQVWESLPDPLQFLVALRQKAQLPGRFWDPAIRLTRYTVEKFGDGCPAP